MLIPRHELRRSSRASTAESLREEGEVGEVQDREDLEKLQEVERHRAIFSIQKNARQIFWKVEGEGCFFVCFLCFFGGVGWGLYNRIWVVF